MKSNDPYSTYWIKWVAQKKIIPRSLSIEEEYQERWLSNSGSKQKDIIWRNCYGHVIVNVSSPWPRWIDNLQKYSKQVDINQHGRMASTQYNIKKIKTIK